MSIAQDMKRITEDIEVSYGERAAFLTDLFKETGDDLKTFRRDHQKMATDLGDFLTLNREAREKLVIALRRKNKKELFEMAEKLANLLKESRKTTKKATSTLEDQIREYLKVVKNYISSMETEVNTLLIDFHQEHQKMAKKTREKLSSAKRQRLEEVKEMLSVFAAENEARSRQLKQQLSSFQKELKKAVEGMRTATVSDLGEARKNWQNLAKIMASKRTGKRVPITEVPKEAEVSKRVEEAAEKAFSGGELKVKMLALIKESPKGISLHQMGSKLKVPYIRLARPIKELGNEGKVVKRDSLYFSYFPASTEA